MTFNLERNSAKILILLILTDLVFVAVDITYRMKLVTNPLFCIESDFGYAEVYQYIKEYWIVLLLFTMAIKRSHIIYFAWSALYMYLLLDDSLQIHERWGKYLVDYFELQSKFSLRAQDLGELGVSVLFGILLFSFIGIAFLYSDHKAKQISKHLFLLVMSLALFGILADMLHTAIPWGKSVWALIEDGGEMVVMSITVWYVFDLKFISEKPASVREI